VVHDSMTKVREEGEEVHSVADNSIVWYFSNSRCWPKPWKTQIPLDLQIKYNFLDTFILEIPLLLQTVKCLGEQKDSRN
jgi:hypothetical protein